jgi:hypothetical protein
MSRSKHSQRPDLSSRCLKRLESELAARGTPLRERSDSRVDREKSPEPENQPRVRRVVIND